jgi:hypothetical protein
MDNRKLGWIAIALGVVALVVALGGRARPMGGYNDGPRGYRPPMAAPQAPQGPQGNFGPQQGPQGNFGPQQGPQGNFGPRGWHGPQGWKGRGRGGFFPFMFIGGLFRLALFGLLIALVARWFFRRRSHQDPPPPAGPSGPGPEQPPYTGGTQAL